MFSAPGCPIQFLQEPRVPVQIHNIDSAHHQLGVGGFPVSKIDKAAKKFGTLMAVAQQTGTKINPGKFGPSCLILSHEF